MKVFMALLVFLLGCYAPSTQMNRISLGMTKAEVIKLLGPPHSVSGTTGVEYLNYEFSKTQSHLAGTALDPHGTYFVRLHDGKVDAFGEKGDFGTTQPK